MVSATATVETGRQWSAPCVRKVSACPPLPPGAADRRGADTPDPHAQELPSLPTAELSSAGSAYSATLRRPLLRPRVSPSNPCVVPLQCLRVGLDLDTTRIGRLDVQGDWYFGCWWCGRR